MTARRNLLLLGVAAAVMAAALFAFAPPDPAPPTGESGQLAFPALASRLGELRRLEFTRGAETLVLERQGDRFVLPARSGYPARQERVREALVGLTELRLLEPRTADPTQHERLGVDDPARAGTNAVAVKLLGAGPQPLAELVVGRRRVRTQGGLPESVYVRRPTDSQSWLAEGRLVVDTDPNLWIDRDLANLPLARVRQVTVRRADAPPLAFATGAGTLRVTGVPTTTPVDEGKVEEVGRAFEYLTLLDVVPESEVPGLALGEAAFAFDGGLTVTAWPSRAGEALWVRLRADGTGEAAAEAERLDARWRGWAYQVGIWKERTLLPRLDELAAGAPAEAPVPPGTR